MADFRACQQDFADASKTIQNEIFHAGLQSPHRDQSSIPMQRALIASNFQRVIPVVRRSM